MDTGGNLYHGFGRFLSRGASRPQGQCQRLLDGRAYGDGRRVPPLHQGYRLCDCRRAGARSRPVSGCGARRSRAGIAGLRPAGWPRQPPRPPRLVVVGPGGAVAAPGRPGKHAGRPRESPSHPCGVRGRGRLRRLGRQGAAVRGRVGAGRPGWPGGGCLLLGRRVSAGRSGNGQHLGGSLPVGKPHDRWLPGHRTGRAVSTEWLRPVRNDRQRLGVDLRLLHSPAP